MPRSSGQSDFVVRRDDSEAVELPRASERATRWVLRVTFLLLGLLALLLAIGPHIPAGE